MGKTFYHKKTNVDLVFAQSLTKDTQYSAGLLTAMGLDATYTRGANDIYIPIDRERLIEQFGWLGIKLILDNSASPTGGDTRLTHIIALPPGTNPQDVVGNTYDAKDIIGFKMAAFPEHT